MKYMVMECHPGYAVVLSDTGRFLKVANMRYEVGQTVTIVVELHLPEVQEQPEKKNNRRWITVLTAMAACLVLMVTSILFTGQIPYASVYMTINPEVRIDVNRNDVVVSVAGVNADGAALLVGYDHRKKPLDLVMDELVDRAIDMGYLHEGGKITLSLDADEKWIVIHKDQLSTQLNEHLTGKITVIIDVEPKKSTTSAPTAPSGTIVIPVGPDNYGDSDYGDSGYGETYGTEPNYSDMPYDADSSYAPLENDGQSSYEETADDDGQTDYGTRTKDSADDWQSEYDATTDDGQSDYTQFDDGQSEYEASDYA